MRVGARRWGHGAAGDIARGAGWGVAADAVEARGCGACERPAAHLDAVAREVEEDDVPHLREVHPARRPISADEDTRDRRRGMAVISAPSFQSETVPITTFTGRQIDFLQKNDDRFDMIDLIIIVLQSVLEHFSPSRP